MRKPICLLLLIAAACGAKSGESKREGAAVEPIDLPASIVDAVQSALPGIEISRFEKELEGGEQVYEVQGTVDGKPVRVEVDAKGRILEIDESLLRSSTEGR